MNIIEKGDVLNIMRIWIRKSMKKKGTSLIKCSMKSVGYCLFLLRTSLFFIILLLMMAAAFRSPLSGGAGTFSYKAAPKIITPGKADGRNDVFFVLYMNLDSQSSLSGKIYNLMGMKVADMTNKGGGGVLLTAPPGGWFISAAWEGFLKWTPAGGISPGIYIWQVEAEGQVYTGTVVVAK